MLKIWGTIYKYSPLILVLVVSSILISINFVHYSNVSKIGTDAVSWFLPAKAVLNGSGAPYSDYWDTKPSGLILFSVFWLATFGDDINSFRLLHLLLVSVCVFGIVRIYYLVLPRVYFLIVSLFSIIVFMSPRIQSQSLLIETFGLSFALIALNILLTEKIPLGKRSYFSALFFVLGGQMKESYAFMGLSMIPFVVHTYLANRREIINVIKSAFLGVITVLLTLALFLVFTKSIFSYPEVIQFILDYGSPAHVTQAIEFPKATYIYLQYKLVPLLSIILVSYVFLKVILVEIGIMMKSNKSTKINLFVSFDHHKYKLAILFVYAVGAVIGFTMQNKFGSHYDAQMVFPIFVLITVPLLIISKSIRKVVSRYTSSEKLTNFVHVISLVAITLLIFPKKDYFIENKISLLKPKNFIFQWNIGNNADMSIENVIKKNTEVSDCIIHIYGWGVGTTYFYADRTPCSRFFLVNLMPPIFYEEYKTDLISRPPAAIVYTLGGADIDHKRFEDQVFDFTSVIKNCYKPDDELKDVFFPTLKGSELSECVKRNA